MYKIWELATAFCELLLRFLVLFSSIFSAWKPHHPDCIFVSNFLNQPLPLINMDNHHCVDLSVHQDKAKTLLAKLDQDRPNSLLDKLDRVLQDLDDIGESIWTISHQNKELFKIIDVKFAKIIPKRPGLNSRFSILPGHALAQWREFKRIIQRAPELYDLKAFSMSNWLNSYINDNDRLRDIIGTVYGRTRADVPNSRLSLLEGLDIETFLALTMFYDKSADIFELGSAQLSSALRLIPVLLRRHTVNAEWILTNKMSDFVSSLEGDRGIDLFEKSLYSSHPPMRS